jgi:Holliday junction DNA helicase RuvA
MSATEVRSHIASGHAGALTNIPGVGKKTAERLVLELREKISKGSADSATASAPGPTPIGVRNETLLALTSLGYGRPVAEKAIRAALAEAPGQTLAVEELIRLALKHVNQTA